MHLVVDTRRDGIRQFQRADALFECFRIGGAIVFGDAEFFLDNLELFPEKEFALLVRDLFVDLAGTLSLQLRYLALLAQ